MMRAFISACFLLLTCTFGRADEDFRFPEAVHCSGELKYREGLPVLTVSGKPEEIGQQIGVTMNLDYVPLLRVMRQLHSIPRGQPHKQLSQRTRTQRRRIDTTVRGVTFMSAAAHL